jgi:hypothetical protein
MDQLTFYTQERESTLTITHPGLDINVCPIPVKTDVGQVDLVLRSSKVNI